MKFLKRAFIVISVMIFVVGAACSRRGGQQTPSGSASSGGEAIVKPSEITVLGTVITWTEEQGGAAFREAYEKFTGIKLNVIKPAHNQYLERLNLTFASGDLPDVLEPAENYISIASNGALYDVTDMYYASPITKGAHLYVAETIKIGGRLYAVPSTHGNGCFTYVRQDWLNQLGLAHPRNWDEFYNLMVTLKNRNPAGAGKQTIPFISAGIMDPMYLRDFYPGHNTQPNFYINGAGRVVEGMYEADMLTGFSRLAQAYREGLIDQESITHTTSAARDKFYTGNVGMFTYWAGTWNDNLQNNTVLNVPTADIQPMAPIEGSVLIDRPAGWTMAIPAANKNPQGVFKYYIEYAFDRGEGMLLFHHGVEGVHWTREGGVYKKLPDMLNPERPQTTYIFNPILTMYPWDDPFPLTPRSKKSLDLFNANAKADKVMTPDAEITGYMAELNTARQELAARIVMGTISPEDGIAQYRRQYDRQVQECLRVLNANLK
jgi:putative aldouronate transport system substrate-binding protein